MKLGLLVSVPAFVGLAAVLGMIGCAQEGSAVESIGQTSDPVVGGTAYAGHPAVMEVMIDGSGYYGTCTGTLIAPDVVLTAAHCMEDYAKNSESARVSNVQTPNRDDASQWTSVASVEVHPTWWTQKYINEGHDCSILKLSRPIAGVTPIPVYRGGASYATDVAVGKGVSLIGYGNNVGSPGSGAGTKRKASANVVSVEDGVIEAGRAGTTTCQGDSGGGLLSTINGVEQVIGITSYGALGCVDAGSFTNVSKTCLDLIRKYVPDDGGTCTPACSGKSCGNDGCGGSCGTCASGSTCNAAGACESTTCTPACSGKSCGNDGCGGSCGTCASGSTCNAAGACESTPPTTSCNETEPNNNTAHVNQLCTAGKYTGTTSGTDYDYLGFTLPAGRSATLSFASRTLNANVVLFRSSGSGWTNVGSGPGAFTVSGGGSYIAILWSTDLAFATYTLNVAK